MEPLIQIRKSPSGRNSQAILRDERSHELVFAVVGHVGSGTSETAKFLSSKLLDFGYEVFHLKASAVITAWATSSGKKVEAEPDNLDRIKQLQDFGDQMRESGDHAAVARALILQIRASRAKQLEVGAEVLTRVKAGDALVPDRKPRAYILDSVRHPMEVHLLRTIYQTAFALIGVVCDEDARESRLVKKFRNAGKKAARDVMKRDEKAPQKHGQRVSDAFYLSDVFLDNSSDRFLDNKKPNLAWDIPDQLSRLIDIITHRGIVRPTPDEAAMHVAYGAQVRSACLSRQVGAALIDIEGNVTSVGTNEVPRAGGGLYGVNNAPRPSTASSSTQMSDDNRCAYRSDAYCSNTREQTNIINEVVGNL